MTMIHILWSTISKCSLHQGRTFNIVQRDELSAFLALLVLWFQSEFIDWANNVNKANKTGNEFYYDYILLLAGNVWVTGTSMQLQYLRTKQKPKYMSERGLTLNFFEMFITAL